MSTEVFDISGCDCCGGECACCPTMPTTVNGEFPTLTDVHACTVCADNSGVSKPLTASANTPTSCEFQFTDTVACDGEDVLITAIFNVYCGEPFCPPPCLRVDYEVIFNRGGSVSRRRWVRDLEECTNPIEFVADDLVESEDAGPCVMGDESSISW